MGDFNDNIKSPKKNGLITALEAIGLREVIVERHSRNRAPRTYARGSRVIDGIYASPTINIRRGGYSQLHHAITDHRLL